MPRLWLGTRFAFFYLSYFAATGVHLPFWPVWLAARGLGAAEIGEALTVAIVGRAVVAPLAAHFADRRGDRKRPIIALAVLALVGFSAFHWARGYWPILILSMICFPAWQATMPLGETMTMAAARAHGLDYGRVRLWGSLSFIALSVIAGRMLTGGGDVRIYALLVGLFAVLVAATLTLPDVRPERAAAAPVAPLRALLADRPFLLFLAANALIQGSHAVYYTIGTLHWRSVGYAEDVIGALWAEGVVAEVILFLFAAPVLRRVHPGWMVAVGGVAAAARWLAMGITDELAVTAVAQALHGISFGAAHLGAIHLIARTVPTGAAATAQSLYSAVAMGLGTGVATFFSGRLYAAFGAQAYWVMAAVAALGVAAALAPARRAAVSALAKPE